MATSLDDLLDLVLPWTPKVTPTMARMMLIRSAISFCRMSKIDRVSLASFQTEAGVDEYILTSPDAAKAVYEIRSVYIDDDKDPIAPARTDDETGTNMIPAKPTFYLCRPGSQKLVLISAPDAVYTIKSRAVLEPLTTATTIDAWIAARHGEGIAYGAIAKLLSVPKKPWTDYQASAGYKGMFDAACIAAQGEADRGNTNAPTRTRSCFGMK